MVPHEPGQPGEGDGERRVAPRYRRHGPVRFTTDEVEGQGTLHDISVTGARLDEVSIVLKPGTSAQLEFAPRVDCLPVRVRALVIREIDNGFAVEFSSVDPRLKRLLKTLVEQGEEAPTPPEAEDAG